MTEITANALPTFNSDQPILLVDADEVLLKFIQHLEMHLKEQGYALRLDTFQLSGNIYDVNNDIPAKSDDVKELISSFFDIHVDTVPAISHAADALSDLSAYYQIAVLTNIPEKHRERRQKNLKSQGFDFPVIANSGGKGPTVNKIQGIAGQKTVFIDDLPPQIASVSKHAPETHLVHFIGDPRLAKLIDKAPEAHIRIDDWREVKTHLINYADRLK